MRIRRAAAFSAALVLLAMIAAVGQQAPPNKLQRVRWTTSRLVGSPSPPPPYRLTRVFPQFAFDHPVYLAEDAASGRFYVGELGGKIYSFRPDDPQGQKDLLLDIKRRLYSFSLHPKFAENGQIFVFSPTELEWQRDKGDQLSRVTRFRVLRDSEPPRLDPASDVIIEWPGGGHNGGEALIGPDGYLYISTGDGTGGSDRKNTGQGVDDLLAVMMRLDIENPDAGRAYSIPPDNPFIGTPGARPEIWAFGFRNPWRFSFDPVTGQPWVGDVGQDLWEMIELVSRGSNHGWSVKEGNHPFHPRKEIGPTPITPPIVEHHHTECRSITGGYFYQGDKFPELKGAYLYGDYQYGKMWGLRYDHGNQKVTWHQELVDGPLEVPSFTPVSDGSFYAIDHRSGGIYELERQPKTKKHPPFPRKLSETGLFTSVKNHQVAPGVVPYSINAPFWSDGALKERFFALPRDGKIEFHEEKAWAFDDGAATVKSFSLEMEAGNPKSSKRIETRIVLKQDEHWVGYTYAWNDKQTDAELVDAGGLDRTYTIRDASSPGGTRKQTWHYPSREECMFCHSRAAGFVLGIKTRQMSRTQNYGEVHRNQIDALDQMGYFKKPLEKPTKELPAFPDPFDNSADLETRARTYLDVNCAMCHVNDGGGNAAIEVNIQTPTGKANLVGEVPMHDIGGGKEMRVVAPGEPYHSVLFTRMNTRGVSQMPPSSTNLVDPRGTALIAEWIRSLGTDRLAKSRR